MRNKFLYIILILIFYVLQGCDGSKQTNTIPVVKSTHVPAVMATSVSATPTVILNHSISDPDSYVSSATDAIKSMKKLSSITKKDINSKEYPSTLRDTQMVLRKFLVDNKKEYIPGLRQEIISSMMCYQDITNLASIEFRENQLYNKFKNKKEVIDVNSKMLYKITAITYHRYPKLMEEVKKTTNSDDPAVIYGATGRKIAISKICDYGEKHIETANNLINKGIKK